MPRSCVPLSHIIIIMASFTRFLVSKRFMSNSILTQFSHDNLVKTVSLNDPKTRNSLSLNLLQDLKTQLQEPANGNLRAIILQSSDPRVFSGGHDLKELCSGNEKTHQEIFDTCGDLNRTIRNCPVPVIAAIDGVAAAAGCQIVAACDIAIATKKSSFSTPGASVGIFCSSPGVPLVRAANLKTSAYMLLTGKAINATQAFHSGLLSRLVEDSDALQRELEECIRAILSKPRGVTALGKKFMYEQVQMPTFDEALSAASTVMIENLKYRDTKEGMSAFLKKRKPEWSHSHDKKE